MGRKDERDRHKSKKDDSRVKTKYKSKERDRSRKRTKDRDSDRNRDRKSTRSRKDYDKRSSRRSKESRRKQQSSRRKKTSSRSRTKSRHKERKESKSNYRSKNQHMKSSSRRSNASKSRTFINPMMGQMGQFGGMRPPMGNPMFPGQMMMGQMSMPQQSFNQGGNMGNSSRWNPSMMMGAMFNQPRLQEMNMFMKKKEDEDRKKKELFEKQQRQSKKELEANCNLLNLSNITHDLNLLSTVQLSYKHGNEQLINEVIKQKLYEFQERCHDMRIDSTSKDIQTFLDNLKKNESKQDENKKKVDKKDLQPSKREFIEYLCKTKNLKAIVQLYGKTVIEKISKDVDVAQTFVKSTEEDDKLFNEMVLLCKREPNKQRDLLYVQ